PAGGRGGGPPRAGPAEGAAPAPAMYGGLLGHKLPGTAQDALRAAPSEGVPGAERPQVSAGFELVDGRSVSEGALLGCSPARAWEDGPRHALSWQQVQEVQRLVREEAQAQAQALAAQAQEHARALARAPRHPCSSSSTTTLRPMCSRALRLRRNRRRPPPGRSRRRPSPPSSPRR
ncbi:unnamed protein product, partial [Prorocentrum cordatum]